MRIIDRIVTNEVPSALRMNISIGATRLDLIADASIEIVLFTAVCPEGDDSSVEGVVYELRDGPMQFLHHFWKIVAGAKVSECVIMIDQQGSDPGGEIELLCVLIEFDPEYLLCFVACEQMEFRLASRGDEVNLVIAIPVFEAVFTVIVFARGGFGLSDVHGLRLESCRLKPARRIGVT